MFSDPERKAMLLSGSASAMQQVLEMPEMATRILRTAIDANDPRSACTIALTWCDRTDLVRKNMCKADPEMWKDLLDVVFPYTFLRQDLAGSNQEIFYEICRIRSMLQVMFEMHIYDFVHDYYVKTHRDFSKAAKGWSKWSKLAAIKLDEKKEQVPSKLKDSFRRVLFSYNWEALRIFVHRHAKYVLSNRQTGVLGQEQFISMSTEHKKKLMDALIEVCVKKVFEYNERLLNPADIHYGHLDGYEFNEKEQVGLHKELRAPFANAVETP